MILASFTSGLNGTTGRQVRFSLPKNMQGELRIAVTAHQAELQELRIRIARAHLGIREEKITENATSVEAKDILLANAPPTKIVRTLENVLAPEVVMLRRLPQPPPLRKLRGNLRDEGMIQPWANEQTMVIEAAVFTLQPQRIKLITSQ